MEKLVSTGKTKGKKIKRKTKNETKTHRPLTHALQKPAPEIGAIGLNSTPDSGARFSCQCTTSNVVDCIRTPTSARKPGAGICSGIEFMATVSAVSVCQGP